MVERVVAPRPALACRADARYGLCVRPSVWSLFAGFFTIGVTGFGGVLPFARRIIVERRGWLTSDEFTDLLALCQFLPGPNVLNMSVALGARYRGVAGAVAAYAGLMAAPMAMIIVLGALYVRFGEATILRHIVGGLAAVASGLLLATALRVAAPLRFSPRGMLVGLTTFGAIFVLRLPLLPVMLIGAPMSVWLAYRGRP
jgi:chromate transporter